MAVPNDGAAPLDSSAAPLPTMFAARVAPEESSHGQNSIGPAAAVARVITDWSRRVPWVSRRKRPGRGQRHVHVAAGHIPALRPLRHLTGEPDVLHHQVVEGDDRGRVRVSADQDAAAADVPAAVMAAPAVVESSA
jgi:hypothetical protein